MMRHVATQPDKSDTKPLTEPVLLILLSLANKPLHGYGLLHDIEMLSNGRVQLSTGTLYGALRRLLQDFWIERLVQADISRDKQAYRLTATGRGHLHLELNRMKQLTQAASARLKTREA
jgi:DNA-binding PadR family transcriptional regulator